MTSLHVMVHQTPVAQGSTRAFLTKSGLPVVTGKNPHGIAAFRLDVIEAVRRQLGVAEDSSPDQWPLFFSKGTAISVEANFVFARPKSHYGTGKNADVRKASAPTMHTSKPDIDKLLRAALDALTIARVWHDDSAVAEVVSVKGYSSVPYVAFNIRAIS